MLVSPDFLEDFMTYSFTLEETIVVVLLQKNSEGFEQPITFFSRALRYANLKYILMENQAYALVESLKYFRVYIFHSQIIAYLPSPTIRDILIQLDNEGKRGGWIANFLEYDLEINPTKLIKGQVLALLLEESNCKALEINYVTYINNQIDENNSQVYPDYVQYEWYNDIIHFL